MSELGLAGRRVLTLESRRGAEIATLIRKAGGEPRVVPALREAPLASNAATEAFAADRERGAFYWVVFLTGGGVDALAATEGVRAALRSVSVAARGAKTASALRGLGIPVAAVAGEPATWRERMAALPTSLAGARVAVQEYGASNPELLAALAVRGALVTAVPVYRWELPADTGPLRQAVQDVIEGRIHVVLFTNAVQVEHLFAVAARERAQVGLLTALGRCLVGSIGPSTSAALERHGGRADFEPSQPRMGVLVHELAQQARQLWERKRTG
jgi:uroporphyrinogen-III synthase